MKANFVYTAMPTAEYKETETFGNIIIAHFEPKVEETTNEDGTVTSTTTCVETSVSKADYNAEELAALYAEWKARREARQLAMAKADKINEITDYDNSDAVNAFIFNGTNVWFKPEMRATIKQGVESCKTAGRATYDAAYNGIQISVPVDTALQVLAQIECYALDCQNITAAHKAAVQKLTTTADVEAYDYKSGYPDKLTITF